MVKKVECLHPELNEVVFMDCRVLRQGDVELGTPTVAQISEVLRGGSQCKRGQNLEDRLLTGGNVSYCSGGIDQTCLKHPIPGRVIQARVAEYSDTSRAR